MTNPVEAVTVEKLKPCPFCGGAPTLCCTEDVGDGYQRDYFVTCDHCGISIHEEYRTKAITAWNTRTQANETMREALTKAADALDRIHRQPIDPDIDVLGKGDADALGIVRDIARRASKRARRALSGDSA